MQYYAINVFTGKEDEFLRRIRPLIGARRIFVPKRTLQIRRAGKVREQSLPVFPGYVFLESEDILAELDAYWAIRSTQGFIRFLRDNSAPLPLSGNDKRLLLHFMSFGDSADTSKVRFDENDRIVVLEGPLKELEGRIVKVDRRKGRAKVALDLCESSFLIDLSFAVVERVGRKDGDSGQEGRSG